MGKMRRLLILVLTAGILSIFSCGALGSPVSVTSTIGYEHRPNRTTINKMLTAGYKLNTRSMISGFLRYRYDTTVSHSFQGLAGLLYRYSISNRSNVSFSLAYVEIYGVNQFDTDRFGVSFSRTLVKNKKANLKMNLSYSTETDWVDSRSFSIKIGAVVKKVPVKDFSLNLGYAISYSMENHGITQERLEIGERFNIAKKWIMNFKYIGVLYRQNRDDVDDVVQISTTYIF